MDWTRVTSVLIERIAFPMLVTDPAGRTRLVNSTFAQLLGRRPDELIGRHFLQEWVSGESRSEVASALNDARIDQARRLEVDIQNEDVHLRLFVDLEAVMDGADRMLIMSVADARRAPGASPAAESPPSTPGSSPGARPSARS